MRLVLICAQQGRVLCSGVDQGKFITYLNKFVAYKKQSKSGSGGYGFVAGVSSDGKVTKCMTLSEFAEALNLEKNYNKNCRHNKSIRVRRWICSNCVATHQGNWSSIGLLLLLVRE